MDHRSLDGLSSPSFAFLIIVFPLVSFSNPLLKGQKWNSDILTKQSKPSLVKSSSKLFFVSRLRGKKYKSGGSSKVLQDTSNTLDSSQTPAQGPQKVCSAGCIQLITTHMPRRQSFSYSYYRTKPGLFCGFSCLCFFVVLY